MKDVRNNELRKMLNKEGIKDVVLNFSEGTCRVYSDDQETNDILTGGFYECEYCMHFRQQTVQTWARWIREVWAKCKQEKSERNNPNEFKFTVIKLK